MEIVMKTRLAVLLAFIASLLSGCGYSRIRVNDEAMTAAW
jgi:hypothetical protein